MATLTIGAVIFDLDGVVTRTASVHATAWKALFDDFLARRPAHPAEDHDPFDIETDYPAYVDGKPRYEGVRSFLESRGITLPDGDRSDAPGADSICGLGNAKDAIFQRTLDQVGVQVYDSTVDLIRALRARDVKTALVSSSKHCGEVIERAGLGSLFDVRVDGLTSEALDLRGKPAPDIFVTASERLGLARDRCVIVEDAIAGVQAGRGGAFGLVIGIDRHGRPEALKNAGAHLVVTDLEQLSMDELEAAFPGVAPNALGAFPELARRLTTTRPALFLDYDGTLTPIVARPELAVLSDAMRTTLTTVARRYPTAIVSGRGLDDVKALVNVPTLYYAGNHGFELEMAGSGERQERGGDHLDTVARAARDLEPQIARIDGAFVENKRYSLSVHYRLAPPDRVADIDAIVEATVARFPALRKHLGKMVFELRPRIEWDKGKAVRWLLEALDLASEATLPIYVGDDETDEDAFRALLPGGIGILVSSDPRPTAALYTLRDASEVRELLEKLVDTGSGLRARGSGLRAQGSGTTDHEPTDHESLNTNQRITNHESPTTNHQPP